MSSVEIHPTSIVDKKAELDTGVVVGPYAIIGADVKIGKNCVIHSHANIQGYTTIGQENQIYNFASIGNPPQDLKYKGEKTFLEIGSRNIIREYVTMQPGTVQGGGKTTVGDENLFMNYSHVAHDCIVGNKNVFANCAQLAGHVTVHNMAVLGGMSAVHQFCVIGDMAMTAGGVMLKQDLPPYCMCDGFRAGLRGLNVVALQRRNVSPEARQAIKNAYKVIFSTQYRNIEEAITHISTQDLAYREVSYFVSFIKSSKRGIVRPANSLSPISEEINRDE